MKKNNRLLPEWKDSGFWQQLCRKMKCVLVFMLILAGGIRAEVYSQQYMLDLKMEETPLTEVFSHIENQTGLKFLYNTAMIESKGRVKVKARKTDVREVLDELLRPLGLTYVLEKDQIVVKKAIPAIPQEKMVIKGHVTDTKAVRLPGVTVRIKGTTIGVVSDNNGYYELTLPAGSDPILVFSFIGMKTQEVVYRGEQELKIVMEENVTEIDEVVVTGIFSKSKESYTGAVSVITEKELKSFGNRNILTSLRNIDPSFNILENNEWGSNPNKLPEIQIRGAANMPDIDQLQSESRAELNTPLIIMDGFEITLQRMMDLDDNEVKSITLLKDASATAIYGSRGANGVVVIETKEPEAGKLKLTYTGSLNIEVPDLSDYQVLDAREKLDLERRSGYYEDPYKRPDYNLDLWEKYNSILQQVERGVNTYWLSKPLRVGMGHRHNLKLEGGDQAFRYSATVQYNHIAGVMKESFRDNFNGGINLSYKTSNLIFRNSLTISLNKSQESPYGTFDEYVKLNPYWTPYDENGDLKQIAGSTGGGGLVGVTCGNPLWNASIGTKNFSKYSGITNNFYIEWQALTALKFIGRLGLSKTLNAREDFYPASHTRFLGYPEDKFFEKGTYSKLEGESSNINMDITANYSLLLDKHQLFLNLNYKMEQSRSEKVTFTMVGFPNDKNGFITSGLGFNKSDYPPVGNESVSREIGILSALNYSYDDRYLADLSYRASASSRFGQDKRWGQFWSAGIGWNLHQEHFLSDAEWLRQLKLRASTGYTGSQNFNSYQALATFTYYQAQAYDNWVGSYLLGLPNDELKWQKTREYNVGMDLNLWSRFSARLDYYVQNTEDQLLDFTIPPSMGFTSYKENLGSTQNKGIELKLNARIWSDVAKDRYMNLFFSIAKNENKIKKISNALKSYNDSQDEELSSGDSNKPVLHYVEGQSVSAIWAVRSLGIDPASGEEMWLTKDGEITSEWRAEDQVVCGDAMPKCTGTFGLNLDYKGIFLNMTFYYQFGGQIYNQTLVDRVENADISMNVDRRIYDAVWKNPDDRVAFSFNPYGNTQPTSRFVQDLNELRLSTFNIGYDFRHCAFLSRIGLERLKASFYMNDVFRASTVKIERGLEYPFARTYSFSLQVTL